MNISTLLADLTLKSTLILASAWLVCLALRRSSAAVRHLVWTLALLGLVLSPALSLVTPWRVPVVPAARASLARVFPGEALSRLAARTSEPGRIAVPAEPLPPAASLDEEPAPARLAPAPDRGPALDVGLLRLWLGGALAVLALSLIGLARVWYLTRRAEPLTDGAWAGLAAELSRELGIRVPLRLRMSPQSSIPMVWGLWRPVLLLPVEAEDWTPERRRVVLLHELAHIQRGDCVIQWLAQLVSAAFWFQPLVWLALKRHRMEREKACDDQVLMAGTRASEYAGHLLDLVASRRAPYGTSAALAMARHSEIEGRLLSILDAHCSARGLSRRVAAVTMLGALALILPLAALQPRDGSGGVAEAAPRQAPPSRPSLAAALGATSTRRAPDASAPLSARWSWGLQQAAGEGAWIGWSFELPMAANDWIGNIRTLEGEIVALVDSGAGRTGEVRKEVAVLLAVPARGAAIEAVRVSNVELPVDLDGRRLVWLGEAGDAESLDLLVRIFTEAGDAGVKANLVETIGVHTTSGVEPFLLNVLRGPDAEEVRAEAASGLGRRASEAAHAALAEATRSDRSPRVRQEAVQGLARHRSPAALIDLVRAAREGAPAEVRRVAAEELGRWPADQSLSVLVEIAYQDSDPEVQRTATEALGNLPGGAGFTALEKIARDHPAPDIRRQAVESLASRSQAGGAQTVETLLRIAFDDPEVQVQKQAVEALAQIHDRTAVEAIQELFQKHPSSEVREEAESALAHLSAQ